MSILSAPARGPSRQDELARVLSIPWPVAALAAVLILSSIAQALRWLDFMGAAVWCGFVVIGLLIAVRSVPAVTARMTGRRFRTLTAITFVLITLVFAVGYPIANSGRFGRGSDREDNLNVATRALLRGENPYLHEGYLGQPADVLVGSMLLAAPFVVLGNSAIQNIFWLAAFVAGARAYLNDGRRALILLWVLLLLAPAIALELISGGDLIANTIYVILAAMLVVRAAGDPRATTWTKVAVAVAFGIALASRLNFGLLVPMVFSLLAARTNWRTAATVILIGGLTVGLLSIPFYLADPGEYSLLRLQNRFGYFQSVLPHAGILVPAATGFLALALSHRRVLRDEADLMRNATVVLGFPVLAGVLLAMARFGPYGVLFAVQGWGLFFLFPGALYYWGRISEGEMSES